MPVLTQFIGGDFALCVAGSYHSDSPNVGVVNASRRQLVCLGETSMPHTYTPLRGPSAFAEEQVPPVNVISREVHPGLAQCNTQYSSVEADAIVTIVYAECVRVFSATLDVGQLKCYKMAETDDSKPQRCSKLYHR